MEDVLAKLIWVKSLLREARTTTAGRTALRRIIIGINCDASFSVSEIVAEVAQARTRTEAVRISSLGHKSHISMVGMFS